MFFRILQNDRLFRKWNMQSAHQLIRFMPFSAEQEHIPRTRHGQRMEHRTFAVGNHRVRAHIVGVIGCDFSYNRLRVFVSGVVGRNDGVVGKIARDLGKLSAAVLCAVTDGAVDSENPARLVGADGDQQRAHRHFVVCVVDDDRAVVKRIDDFQPSGNSRP